MNLTRTLRSYRSYRSTVQELEHFATRELADIGISRSDIPAVAGRSVR